MGNVFGRKKEPTRQLPPVTEHDQAILQLKTQRDKIKQFIKRTEKSIEKEREMAKKLISDGRKDRALLLLKKKRLQETAVTQALGQLDQVERLTQDLEMAGFQQQVVEQLRRGNESLKKMNALLDRDEIEKIMDETKEAAEYQEEISSLLSGMSSEDVACAEEELEELLRKAETVPELPKVPDHPLPEREKVAEKPARERVAVAAD